MTDLREVYMEHLQPVWHDSRERLTFRTPGSVPVRDFHLFLLLIPSFSNLQWIFRLEVWSTFEKTFKCYKNEHSFEIWHWAWSSPLSCKISRRYDQPFSKKWRLKWTFLVVFRILPNWNFHFRSGLWKAGCDVVRLYVLQSCRSCTFCKRKTRGETQFWIELAAPCTLLNQNEINSDDTLPFIIFLTPVSFDCSNRLWRQRLLISPCSLWRHKQTLFGVIGPLTGGKCRTFCRVIERFCFHRYLCFHCIFCVRVFVYCFLRTEWPCRTITVFILIAL